MRHVVIVGGGFAGVSAARRLARAPVRVTLVDRANHHTFQPLLYQTATAAVSPGDITAPIRWMLRRQRNVTVLQDDVESVEVGRRRLRLAAGELTYDHLILAAGARHAYPGHPEWEPWAPGLKTVEDALEIRNRFLGAFERAERSDDPAERAACLTIVVVGGGPTGVELAGVMPVIARKALAPDFRRIDAASTRVVLLEAGPRLLPSFPERLANRARRDLERFGVEVRANTPVESIDAGGVRLRGESIRSRTVLWAAGNRASPLTATLGAPLDRAGRVQVRDDLSLPGHPEVFAVGDLARLEQGGAPVPWTAPAANQQGRHAAANLLRDLEGRPRRPFRYRNRGNLATIGRHRAIADFGRLRLAGIPAWWLWLFVHVLYLAGFRNRLSVLLSWAYQYFTFQRGVRLITAVERRDRRPWPAGRAPRSR